MTAGNPTLAPPQLPPGDLFRLTVKQYHDMIERGILPEGEPFELLGGVIVRKNRAAAGESPMTVGSHHVWVVQVLESLGPKLVRRGVHLRSQKPITIPPRDEPEPDAAIVTGDRDRYVDRHPLPREVLCAIEVADSSLALDRAEKFRLYAGAGIPQYVIINLADAVIEVYTNPRRGRYIDSAVLAVGKSLLLPTAAEPLKVPVRSLLPPRR